MSQNHKGSLYLPKTRFYYASQYCTLELSLFLILVFLFASFRNSFSVLVAKMRFEFGLLRTGSFNPSKRPDFALFSSGQAKTTETIKIININFVYPTDFLDFSFMINNDTNQPFLKFFSFLTNFTTLFFQFIYNSGFVSVNAPKISSAAADWPRFESSAQSILHFGIFDGEKEKKMSKIEISGETYKIKLPISPFLNPGSFFN